MMVRSHSNTRQYIRHATMLVRELRDLAEAIIVTGLAVYGLIRLISR
jgi:hypothetical protein